MRSSASSENNYFKLRNRRYVDEEQKRSPSYSTAILRTGGDPCTAQKHAILYGLDFLSHMSLGHSNILPLESRQSLEKKDTVSEAKELWSYQPLSNFSSRVHVRHL